MVRNSSSRVCRGASVRRGGVVGSWGDMECTSLCPGGRRLDPRGPTCWLLPRRRWRGDPGLLLELVELLGLQGLLLSPLERGRVARLAVVGPVVLPLVAVTLVHRCSPLPRRRLDASSVGAWLAAVWTGRRRVAAAPPG